MSDATVRQATHEDHEAIAAFTEDTWDDRDVSDYIPEVFPEWVAADEDTRTVVADSDGTAVGLCQATVLSEWEGWLQGMRVHPDHRGEGLGVRMVEDLFSWCRERGVKTARNMVFSWNDAGMGNSRAAGFEPGIEVRWAKPTPDAETAPELSVTEDPDTAWAFWHGSDARESLGGLGLDPAESWALSAVTRERLHPLDDGRVFSLRDDDGVRATTARLRVDDHGEDRTAVYGHSAWATPAAARALFDAIAADAAALGVDATRVLLPETPRHVSDVAAARVPISDEPVFVFEASLG